MTKLSSACRSSEQPRIRYRLLPDMGKSASRFEDFIAPQFSVAADEIYDCVKRRVLVLSGKIFLCVVDNLVSSQILSFAGCECNFD